jgi:hypothetical protein
MSVGPSPYSLFRQFVSRRLFGEGDCPLDHDSVHSTNSSVSKANLTILDKFRKKPSVAFALVWLHCVLLLLLTQLMELSFTRALPTVNDFSKPLQSSLLASVLISIPIAIDAVFSWFVESVDDSVERDFVRLFGLVAISIPNLLMYLNIMSKDLIDLKQFFQFILLFELAIYYIYQIAAIQQLSAHNSFLDISVGIGFVCVIAFFYNLSEAGILPSRLAWRVVFSIGE